MKRALPLWCLLLGTGCFEDIVDEPYLIDEPRILAVRPEPAEARPGEAVSYSLLVAGETQDSPSLFFCTEPRRAEERGALSEACATGSALEAIGESAQMLANACALFGPNTPPTEGDEPPRRPADADATGGYYLPIVVELSGRRASAQHRVRCDLPNVTRDVFSEFEERYRANEHPIIAELELPTRVPANSEVAIALLMAPGSDEDYLRYDEDRAVLVDDKEVLRAAFYTSDGLIEAGEIEVVDGRAATRWNAPNAATSVDGWVVVRDSRGGVDWRIFRIEVE